MVSIGLVEVHPSDLVCLPPRAIRLATEFHTGKLSCPPPPPPNDTVRKLGSVRLGWDDRVTIPLLVFSLRGININNTIRLNKRG